MVIEEIRGEKGTKGNQKRKEAVVMKLAILIIIIALGLMMPLYWIIASLTSVVSFFSIKWVQSVKEKMLPLIPIWD